MIRGIYENERCACIPDSRFIAIPAELIMLKMKLPRRTAEEGGGKAAEDERDVSDGNLRISSVSHTPPNRSEDSARRPGHPLLRLDKEAVFEWFGLHLSPAKRIEFMCGLLHMCQPLELRFLGSCLEDLARKDFHVLRDFEIRANNPSDLGLLTDVADPVVRSRLLVSLSLLGSENRECAGILFRILSHVDAQLYFKNRDLAESSYRNSQHLQVHPPCGDGGEFVRADPCCGPALEPGHAPLDQLSLLFTMASLHPAFPFHQRETVRVQLEKVERVTEEERKRCQHTTHARNVPKRDPLSPSAEIRTNDRVQSPHPNQTGPRNLQTEAVHIEKIVLKGVSGTRTDREYTFLVKWSDSSSSTITKSHHELDGFLLKLLREPNVDSFERGIQRLLSQADRLEGRNLERALRERMASAPPVFRQSTKVCVFFHSDLSSEVGGCVRCVVGPSGKTPEHLTEDGSDASSQEEDTEPYVPGHRKKPGRRSPSLGLQNTKSPQSEVWRSPHAELNGVTDWRRKSSALTPKSSPGPAGIELQQHPVGEKWSCLPENRSKGRPATGDREKGKKPEGRPAMLSNGVVRTVPPQLMRQLGGKGAAQDAYGETSSESYSSPSSPLHDGRESLDSEDEKDRDTDSNSDDPSRSRTDGFPLCKPTGGAAVATVRPMVPRAVREGPLRLDGPTCPPDFPQLAFMQPVTYVVQNGSARAEKAPGGKAPGGVMVTLPTTFRETPLCTTGDIEKLPPEPGHLTFAASHPSLAAPVSPAIQPLVQRFKTAPHPPSPEGGAGSTAVHQPPMGAISVIPPGPAYASPLQPAYPSTDACPALAEPHAKGPPLSLPAGLPTPFSFSVAPPASAAGQSQATAPPAVPGPALTPSPALSHNVAPSDGASSAQQQPGLPQAAGCGTCGCRGTCGAVHAPGYCYPPQLARQVFSVQPFLHLTSLCASSYLSQAAQTGTTAAQLPFFPPAAYTGGPLLPAPSDPVLGAQAGYSLQQVAFGRFYQPLFPSMGMVPGMKKGGAASCYNCGVSGHYAHDCKQPSIDAAQQGVFRLKIVAPQPSESLDKSD